MSTWHQDQARTRAHEAGQPIRHDHPCQWTVYTNAPNRATSAMLYSWKAEAEKYLANLKARVAMDPDNLEWRLEAEHSHILPPRLTLEERAVQCYLWQAPGGARSGLILKAEVGRLLLDIAAERLGRDCTPEVEQAAQRLQEAGRLEWKGWVIGPVGN